jgi:putative transposase
VLACCRILKLSKASFYRKPAPRKPDEVKDALVVRLAERYSRLGYRRIALKAGMTPKATRLRLERLKLMKKRKPKRVRVTCPVPEDAANLSRKPTKAGELLASDFTFVQLPKGFAYVAVTLDVFSRRIRGYSVSRNMKNDFVLEALTQAVVSGPLAKGWIHHSDRGSQYASQAFRNLVSQNKGVSSFSRPGCPQDNPFAESFFARFKDEEVWTKDYQDFNEVVESVHKYIEEYNQSRQHSSLGNLTPALYERLSTEKPKTKRVSI